MDAFSQPVQLNQNLWGWKLDTEKFNPPPPDDSSGQIAVAL